MSLRLRMSMIICKHNPYGFPWMLDRPRPPPKRSCHEARKLVREAGIVETIARNIKPVFEIFSAVIGILEDDEVLRLEPQIDDPPIFVVDLGRDAGRLIVND